MSSIAYVTDESMFEYHRLHGNKAMNFWRPRSQQQFTDFHPGDFLFFFSKAYGYQEKGILGYAKFVKQENMSVNKMWEKYECQNGFDEKQEWLDALSSFSLDQQLPKTISSLVLEDVVYFNSPIFAKDLGISLSDNLESYLYLDKDEDITSRIFEMALRVGVDYWTVKNYDDAMEKMHQDYCCYVLKNQLQQNVSTIKQSEKLRLGKLLEKSKQEGYELFYGKDTCYKKDNDNFYLRFLFSPSQKDFARKFEQLAGKMLLVSLQIEKHGFSNIKYEIMSDRKEDKIQELTEVMNKWI